MDNQYSYYTPEQDYNQPEQEPKKKKKVPETAGIYPRIIKGRLLC